MSAPQSAADAGWLAELAARARFAWERLAASAADPGAPLPAWTAVLQRVVAAAPAAVDAQAAPPLTPDDPIPFEQLLLPAVLAARDLRDERLAAHPAARAVLDPRATHALERALLAHLAAFCGKPLLVELSRLRTFGENLLSELELPEPAASGDARYRQWVHQQLNQGLVPVLRAYPVMARLIASSIELWVQSTVELALRLQRDLPELARAFAPDGRELGPVVGLDPMVSDRHEGGRGVVLLAFAGGTRIVYKPRDLALHVAWNGLIERVNAGSGLPALPVLRVLARDGYGWVELAAGGGCESEADAGAYHVRAGMLLCLLHVLRATDCHHENLIARGAEPVLVDVETLLHPRDLASSAASVAGERAVSAAPIAERFLDSVLRTGMLPRWRFSADQRVAYDVSALGSVTPQRVPRKVERWLHVNSDAMCLRPIEIDFPLERNVPTLHGSPLDPAAYRREICSGFCALYDHLLARRDELLAEHGPLAALAGVRARYVFRNSQVYGSVLYGAYTPEALQDGAAFSAALEPLARAFTSGAAPEQAAPLLAAELRALERQDIPLFYTDTARGDLFDAAALQLPGYFAQSSWQDVRDQLRAMGPVDRALQVAIIDGAFDALSARSAAQPERDRADGEDRAELSSSELLAEALAIGEQLYARAVDDERGGASWLGFGYVPEAERYQHQVLGHRLYDGAPGVALFLAALSVTAREPRFGELARRAIVDLRAHARAPRAPGAAPPVLGAALGMGGALYALSEIGTLLADPAICADALALAESLSDDDVASDVQHDLMAGAAGMILGLCAVHRATGDARVLELAAACGRRLLATQRDGAWPTLGEVALTGLSHGAAGIAYALMRLHALTGERDVLDAARRALAYERAVFTAHGGRWLDLRPAEAGSERGGELVQWCHGAAGIALARVGCAQLAPDAELQREIDGALTVTSALALGAIDHVCCGNAGRIEAMLAGSRHTGNAALAALALSRASSMVQRARSHGGYRSFGNLPATVWNPGLFQGTSGIGFLLLRLHTPTLRSFAVWE